MFLGRRSNDRDPVFPQPIRNNGRLYWWRSHLEKYKRQLYRTAERLGMRVENDDPKTPHIEPDSLVPSKVVAAEFGVHRRTLGRRIAKRTAELAPDPRPSHSDAV